MASNPLVAKAAQDMVASQKRHPPSVRTIISDIGMSSRFLELSVEVLMGSNEQECDLL